MAKSQETWNKKEKEKKKQKKKEDKAQKKEERKAHGGTASFDDMIAYVDEYGNITSTPPDPTKRKKINADNIEIGVPKQKPVEAADLNRKGVITFFNESKGFGFIKDSESQDSVFTHINGHLDNIKEGDKVTFLVEQGPKGLNAVEVRLQKP
jgi:cold shock CspA family protein